MEHSQQDRDEAMDMENNEAPAQLLPSEAQDPLDDDAPEFINMNDAVEVQVDDDDVPMDDDDDTEVVDADEQGMSNSADQPQSSREPVVDMSKAKIQAHADAVYTVACHLEHGKLLIISGGGDDKAYIHQIASTTTDPVVPSSQLLSYNHTDTVSCVAFNLEYVSDDPKKTPRLAAVGSYDGSILIYDPDSAEQKLKLEGPSDVEWISFHPKGGSVLLAGSGDGTVWMFHIPLNRCLQVFVGHEQAVTAGCFSPDGKWALSASADGTLRIWAPKTGMNKHVFRTGAAGLTCIARNGGSDGMLVIAGAEDGQAHVCHIGTKKIVASLRHYEVPPSPPSASGEEDEEAEIEYPMSVEAVGFFPAQANWCATAGVDGKLKIWDLANDGQCRQVCVPPQEEGEGSDSITRLRWHPTLPLVFTTSISGKTRLWDARNGSLLTTLTGHTDVINDADVQFMENGAAVFVSAGDDKTIRAFEVDANALLAQQAASASS
jgi:WD40 repeat protein